MFGETGFGDAEGSGSSASSRPTRRHPRISTLGRAFASIGDGQEGSVLDMSHGGILLRLKWMLNPGSAYFLKLFLNGKVAVVEARVVRLVTRSDDCLVGMEFVRVAPQDRQTLRAFINRF